MFCSLENDQQINMPWALVRNLYFRCHPRPISIFGAEAQKYVLINTPGDYDAL